MLTHLPLDDLPEESPLYFLGRVTSDSSLACAIADGLVDPVSKVDPLSISSPALASMTSQTPFNLPEHMDMTFSSLLTRSSSLPHSNSSSRDNISRSNSASQSSTPATAAMAPTPTPPKPNPSNSAPTLSALPTPASAVPVPASSLHSTPRAPKKSSEYQKNLRDFFTPVSSRSQKTTPTVAGKMTVLNRSTTCPTLSAKKPNILSGLTCSSSPVFSPSAPCSSSSFHPREKKKNSPVTLTMSSYSFQNKKQKISSPALRSTKVPSRSLFSSDCLCDRNLCSC
jgi:hypothetical protein